MNESEFGSVVQPLLDAFPMFAEFYRKNRDNLRAAWLKQLERTHAMDARKVVEQLVCGDLEMPPNYEFDRVGIFLKKEAGEIRARRDDRRLVAEKYLRVSEGSWESLYSQKTGHIAIELGAMVKRGEITREQNDEMMASLLSWDKGGAEPDWLKDFFTQLSRKKAKSPFQSV